MDLRQERLQQWLVEFCKLPTFQIDAMPGDASFRRYFRIHLKNNSFVAMDAPPLKENCAPFVAIANGLNNLGLNTPNILASDIPNGFLLISDFGDQLLLKELNAQNAENLYDQALTALSILQTCRKIDNFTIPFFTAEFMRQELELFKEWYLKRHLNLILNADLEIELGNCFDFLAKTCAAQPQVFMHRDYHSANLMLLPDNQVGILDFQDAFIGPVTYDLASLLRDCYISWPDTLIEKLILNYREKINLSQVSKDEFLYWFDMMGLQRHMKALLTFSRKLHRDQNYNYLQYIPRTLEYILKVSSRYPECKVVYQLIVNQVPICAQ